MSKVCRGHGHILQGPMHAGGTTYGDSARISTPTQHTMLLLSSKYEKTCPDGSEPKRIHSCRQAAAEGLDPFLDSIPEANREVVVARLFEDIRSATTQAKYIDNGRWRDYGAYADRGYYVIAAHATIMALHRQCPKSFTTLPAHAQELCLGLLVQLVRLAPLVTHPEGNDGLETAKEVLGRLSGAARIYATSEQPPFLVRLLGKQKVSPDDTIHHAWNAKWTVKLGEILGCCEAAAWLRGIETARGVGKLLAKATQLEEGGTSAEATRAQKSKSKRVREVRQAPAKKPKATVVGGEKVRSKARVEAPVEETSEEHERATQGSEADGGNLEAEEERIRAQFEELERAKKGFEAERAEIEGGQASFRAQFDELEGGKKVAEAEKRRLERATASIRAQYEELERAKKSFEAEREKFEEEKAILRARLEELDQVDAAEAAPNEKGNEQRDQSEDLKTALKAREKELKRKWKDEKRKLENEKKDLEEQVRGYENVNEVLKKELEKQKAK
jgi:hypothetical protein